MGDSWEDWDEETVAVPGTTIASAPDPSKFADEDQTEEEPKWKASVPETQKVRGGGGARQPLNCCT